MPYSKATQKTALKNKIASVMSSKNITLTTQTPDPMDAVAEAIADWLGDVLPLLTVTVAVTSVSGVTTGPANSFSGPGTGTGTIS